MALPEFVEVGRGIFPPPDVGAVVIVAEDLVEVAIAVDVVQRAAGLEVQRLRLDDATFPAGLVATIPHQRRALLAERETKSFTLSPSRSPTNGGGLLIRVEGTGKTAGSVCSKGVPLRLADAARARRLISITTHTDLG